MINARLRGLFLRFRRCRRGAVVVEFALITPVMMMALVALADYGLMVYQNTELSEAASAGARFAMTEGNQDDDAGIRAAALSSLSDSINATVTVIRQCRCPTGGAVACDSECSGEIVPGRYLEVVVNCPYAMIFDYPGIETVDSLQSHAVVRVPQ
jgi:Flp pilus assembly protein TadG